VGFTILLWRSHCFVVSRLCRSHVESHIEYVHIFMYNMRRAHPFSEQSHSLHYFVVFRCLSTPVFLGAFSVSVLRSGSIAVRFFFFVVVGFLSFFLRFPV